LTQKTWFITGINSGFGRVITELLLQRGDRVAGTARKLGQLDDLKKRYSEPLWVTSLDVTDDPAIRKAVDAAFQHFGRIDVIVNNAGYAIVGAAEEFTDEQLHHQLNTNLLGSIQVVRAALPHLRKQNGGRIVQMSSIGGQIAVPGMSIYHVSKWGIEGFFETLSQELAPFHIQTTIVEPGGGRTSIFDEGRLLHAQALAGYENTPARQTGTFLASGSYIPPGDPARMMQAVIDSVDQPEAPRRLVLGSDAYTAIHDVLTKRLAALEGQKDLALSTDVDGGSHRDETNAHKQR
jgi:NAD(P)-dependent dehydrogenase (short-subunit alcohol dehydrogenase family)